jgi:hypothetical protein
MTQEKNEISFPKKTARVLLKVILFLFLFIVLLFLLILTPPVQRFMTGKVETYLQKKLKTDVNIGSISFGLSGKLNLQNIYIEDKTGDTLLSGGSIKTHINFLKLFSNEVQVKDIELQNITAKIKRVLPDTAFNFQFIVDAFMTEQTAPDTTTTPMKLNISDITLENVRVTYVDDITGLDLYSRVGNLSTTIDTLNPYTYRFDIPSIIARNVQTNIRQYKPLVTSEPLSNDMADISETPAIQLSLGTIDLARFNVQFDNDVSKFYSTIKIGKLKTDSRLIDLEHNRIYLDNLELNDTKTIVHMGKSPQAKVIEKEATQEVEAQKTKGWDFRIASLSVDNNTIGFENDNEPKLAHGLDYAHLLADDLNLHVNNFVFDTDSIAGNITKGTVKEKSGLNIQALEADFLYGNTGSYIKDLYIKTPGTELRRSLVLDYASYEALTNNLAETEIDIELVNSQVQVKDILLFAPQLRNNAAFANPNDIWHLNIVGSGTFNDLNFETLKFRGLQNTVIDAEGTLAGLMKPTQAGGNFVIHKFHTTQTDIALFTGQRLSTPQLNLPEAFDISGTVNGTAGRLNTDLQLNSSAGNLSLRGTFSNLTSPTALAYNARIRTNGLRLGSILRQQGTIGSLSGTFAVNGRGSTPATIHTTFRGNVNSVGYNNYQYHDISMNGWLRGSDFEMHADVNDPNADLNLTATGNFSANPSFAVDGMIDSIKTLPLNLTTQPLVFRGKVNAVVDQLTADYLDANIWLTNALLVSSDKRLALDTVHLLSGRNDSANYIRLTSDIANAEIKGQYRFTDLASIIANSIQPYFEVTPPAKLANLKPYDFTFSADLRYDPIFSAFVPSLTAMDPLHAQGSFDNDSGMQAVLSTPHISVAGNELNDLSFTANTGDSGLQINATVAQLKSGAAFNIYNTKITAWAVNNVINFNLAVDDQNNKGQYYLAGIVNQPSTGTYAMHLMPDSVMLNYDKWNVAPDNLLTIGTTSITANNFVLSKGKQQLSITSLSGSGTPPPLQVAFQDFKIATITSFMKSDTTFADGVINGNVTFKNIMQAPAFTSNLTIQDLSFSKDTIGNVAIHVNTSEGNSYVADATISGNGNDVELKGTITPSGDIANVNLDVAVRQLKLSTLEGVSAGAITNASGAVTGNAKIVGNLSNPDIQGKLQFQNTSFALAMLGSQFFIDNETLAVTEDGINFQSFTIKDSASNALTLNGTISTQNLTNYNFNLYVNATDFMVLNTTKKPNSIYYGRMNITTDMHLSGTEATPVLDGAITVNDGTNLTVVVPQEEPGVVQRKGIVEFVDMDAPENDSLFRRYDSLNYSKLIGMDVAVNINIKKEAIFNVIVDEANGDLLNVRGEALLSAGIDPSGKITLVGNYQLEEGAYQVSFNFLQRRFDIVKGSTITWTGSPTSAELDIDAVYIANTAPIDLVQDQIAASTPAIRNTYLQKLPFHVQLFLTGELMRPIVDFNIVLPEDQNYGVSNDIITQVQTRLTQLRADEGEINKQVFSLLLLGRFVGEDPFQSSGAGFSAGTFARQSVSKLLTEQLNKLAGGLIGGVDLNFNIASTEDYTTGERRNRTDLNIGLSKRLLNDRLQVTVGSNFELEGPESSTQKNNNIAGDVAVTYQLSKDGKYMLRFYRKNEYVGVVDGYIIETGLGFILNVDYNKFKEIFTKKKVAETPAE